MPNNEPLPGWHVRVAQVAEADLNEIIDHFIQLDEIDHAADIVDAFSMAKEDLETLPLRAHFTHELQEMGIYSHREVHFNVYRVIFRINEDLGEVQIDAILDGRRDVAQILTNRLLRIPEGDSNTSL